MLVNLRLAIKGEVVLTQELVNCLDSLAVASVPTQWNVMALEDEFLWLLPGLGRWFQNLLMRYE